MQKAIQEFTIGFYDSSGVFSIFAKQDDTERVVKFHLHDEGNEYTDLLNTGNLTAFVREELPSGGALPDIEISSSNIDAANSAITVPLTADMLQEAGVARCDLLFMERVSDTEFRLLSTTRFKLIISDNVGTPNSGVTKEWFENWTELYIALKTLEADFENNEEQRQDNEDTRITNENARISAENIRVSSENTRISNENTRKSNENARIENENERNTNEAERQNAESVRQANEQTRSANEDVRLANETTREENETTRLANEATREENESARIENESTRQDNESERVSNETTRQENETTRIANETERISHESTRQDAEASRISAESERQAAELIRETRVQEQVDEAHMWANGNNSSTAPEDTPSATNNAMYWCQQAHQVYDSVFNGTVAEWNALSTEDKAKFVTVILIDD